MSESTSNLDTQTTGEVLGQRFSKGSLRLLQLTDTHLYADPNGKLLGVNTLLSLRQVIGDFLSQDWTPDLVLATGDLCHDGSTRGYGYLMGEFSRLQAPVYCLAGNHDEVEQLTSCLQGGNISAPELVDVGQWRFILLNTHVPGKAGGALAKTELDRLELQLAETDKHVLVCLHHQPVPIGSIWLDTMAVENGDAMLEIIDRHRHVRGILWGHVHQTYDQMRNQVRMMASPSTCVQFASKKVGFTLDTKHPGYRLLVLQPDGQIFSEVLRLEEQPEGLNTSSGGY